jgi:hypothetical protein
MPSFYWRRHYSVIGSLHRQNSPNGAWIFKHLALVHRVGSHGIVRQQTRGCLTDHDLCLIPLYPATIATLGALRQFAPFDQPLAHLLET